MPCKQRCYTVQNIVAAVCCNTLFAANSVDVHIAAGASGVLWECVCIGGWGRRTGKGGGGLCCWCNGNKCRYKQSSAQEGVPVLCAAQCHGAHQAVCAAAFLSCCHCLQADHCSLCHHCLQAGTAGLPCCLLSHRSAASDCTHPENRPQVVQALHECHPVAHHTHPKQVE